MSTRPRSLVEPTSAAAVQRWIEKHTRASDRFAHIADKYEPHRKQHGCVDVYPSSNGPLLGALAAAPDMPGLEKMGQYRLRILDPRQWLTGFMDDGTAISVRV